MKGPDAGPVKEDRASLTDLHVPTEVLRVNPFKRKVLQSDNQTMVGVIDTRYPPEVLDSITPQVENPKGLLLEGPPLALGRRKRCGSVKQDALYSRSKLDLE